MPVTKLLAAALIVASSATVAQTQQQTTGKDVLVRGKKNTDPNRQVCRTIESTGSRLQRKRECRTAREWAEQQALDRQSIERSQAARWKNN